MDTTSITAILMIGLIKPLLLLGIISLLWWLLRKKSASLQHFVLTLGIVGILFLPLLANFLPKIEISFSQSAIPAIIEWINYWVDLIFLMISKPETNDAKNSIILVTGIYLLGMSSLLFYLLIDILAIALQTKSAKSITHNNIRQQLNALCELFDIKRTIHLVTLDDVSSPQTWGLLNPVIILPKESSRWDDDKILGVLTHELAHIARYDWLTMLVVKITCALFWFLPPLWWVANKIYQQAEIACDDYIFKIREKNISYAQTLLSMTKNSNNGKEKSSAALSIHGQSPLYDRIIAILDKQRPHHPIPIEDAQYWVICGGFVVIMLACIQLIPVVNKIPHANTIITDFDWMFPSPKESIEKGYVEKEPKENNRELNWQLLQELKSKSDFLPHRIDKTEEVKISVPRLAREDLASLGDLEADNVLDKEKTNIEIIGYLPIAIASPVYPVLAIEKGIEGWVQVEFDIDANGAVVEPTIIARSGSRVFDKAVLSAIKKSQYQPQMLNGVPIRIEGVTETFRFKLTESTLDSDFLEKSRR